jgi:hypothetical protein
VLFSASFSRSALYDFSLHYKRLDKICALVYNYFQYPRSLSLKESLLFFPSPPLDSSMLRASSRNSFLPYTCEKRNLSKQQAFKCALWAQVRNYLAAQQR